MTHVKGPGRLQKWRAKGDARLEALNWCNFDKGRLVLAALDVRCSPVAWERLDPPAHRGGGCAPWSMLGRARASYRAMARNLKAVSPKS